MAAFNSNPNTTSSFTFTSPIKLDRTNYTIWKSQVLTSVRVNGLEDFLDSSKLCLNQFSSDGVINSDSDATEITAAEGARENPAFVVWKRKDHMLLSCLMSSINLEILSLVVNSNSSLELWTSLEQQFGSESFAKKVHMKMMLNNLRKGVMSMTEFFNKLKTTTDELAVAGSHVSSLDFLTHLISGLGQPYYPVVVYIEANLAKTTINEAYSMLLTHEARLDANQLSSSKEAKMNFAVNVAQTGQYNANWNKNQNGNGNNNGGRGGFGRGFPQGQVRGNWNGNWKNAWNGAPYGNYQGRGGFGSGNGNFAKSGGFHNGNGKGSSDPNFAGVICQICFKPEHTAAECRNRFNREFIPFNSSSGYNSYQYPVPRSSYVNSAPRAAFVATS